MEEKFTFPKIIPVPSREKHEEIKWKSTNLEEFKNLIKRYKTITLEEITSVVESTVTFEGDYKIAIRHITGFGTRGTCSLCKDMDHYCIGCIHNTLNIPYQTKPPCIWHETYDAIEKARSPQELLTAYRNRSDYMIEFLKQHYNIEI